VLIREVMTESVVTADPRHSVRAVAELMRERNVGSVVLVAVDHAASPVITVEPDIELDEGAQLMMRQGG
jgi:CBS domain-containing protein